MNIIIKTYYKAMNKMLDFIFEHFLNNEKIEDVSGTTHDNI